MKYELVNPSDHIEFEAPNLETAAIATMMVGRGNYGARALEEGQEWVPIFLIKSAEKWTKEKFGKTIGELFDEMNKNNVSECLRSFHCLKERSSLNDIVGYAHELAEKLLTQEEEQ